MDAYLGGEPPAPRHELEDAVGRRDEAPREADPLRLVSVENALRRALAQDRRELPREVDGVADARVHSLPTDRAVDVGGVAEEEDAPAPETSRHSVMDPVGREPLHSRDVDAHPLQEPLAHIVPARFHALLLHIGTDGADQPCAPLVCEREDRGEVARVQRHVQLAVHQRSARLDVGYVEKMLVGAARRADVEPFAHGRAGAVAAGEEDRLARPSPVEPRRDPATHFVEVDELDPALDLHAQLLESVDQEPLVLVLRVDQAIRERAPVRAQPFEIEVGCPPASRPQIDGGEREPGFDYVVGDTELPVEFQRARLHRQRARSRSWLVGLVDDADPDAQSDEPKSEHETGRSSADDEDLSVHALRDSTHLPAADTKRRASRASSIQLVCGAERTIHSFINRPSRRGSKRLPAEVSTSSSTRLFGSFKTSSSLTSITKILPPALSTTLLEPHPFSTVTPVSGDRTSTRGFSAAGTAMATSARTGLFFTSSSLRLLASEDKAGATRFGHELLLRKSDDITLEVDQGLTAVHDPRTGFEQSVRHRAQEIDLELERGERLALLEKRNARHPHRCVCKIAEDASVEGPHRVCVLVPSRLETEDRRTFLDLDRLETDQGRDRRRKLHRKSLYCLSSKRPLNCTQHLHCFSSSRRRRQRWRSNAP